MSDLERLARYEAAIAAAQPGPWHATPHKKGAGDAVSRHCGDFIVQWGHGTPPADARFIALARNAMPGLVATAKLAHDLAAALDGVLGTPIDQPDYEDKRALAEAVRDRAAAMLGRNRHE